MLFSRWGAFAYRFRRPIVLVTVLFAIASAVVGARVTSALSAGGWVDPTSESFAVRVRDPQQVRSDNGRQRIGEIPHNVHLTEALNRVYEFVRD